MKIKKLLLVAVASCISSLALADACFYEDSSFRGQRFCLNEGQQIDNLDRSGWNDKISSISLDRGTRVRVCSDAYFSGDCRMISSDEYNFASTGMNDQISSIEVMSDWGGGGGGRGSVCFYTDWNYSGAQFCLDRGGRMDNLDGTGFNDQISSIQIPRGMQVTVCTDAYFRGLCQTYNRDVIDFNRLGINDRISSISVDGGRWGGR